MSLEELRDEVLEKGHRYFEEFKKNKSPFVPGETYIPASGKCLDSKDLSQLLSASLDLWLTCGPYSQEFERVLSKSVKALSPAIFVNSGSSASLIAASCLIKPGDEVICTAVSFPTTVNPVIQCGGVPVFIDVNLKTLNAELSSIQKALTKKTKGVILSHTLGNPFAAEEIRSWCHSNKLFLIEDCCDALGAKYGEKFVGTFGDISTFSFYPAHHITTGEGGALIANNVNLRKKAESFRDWGRDCWCEPGKDNTCGKRFEWKLGDLPEGYDHKYTYSQIGFNLKGTDLQAALGISQMEKLPIFLKKRQANYDVLFNGVKNSPKLSSRFQTLESLSGATPAWFGFPLHCQSPLNRLSLTTNLEENKIGTRLVFAGNLTKQPAYKNVTYRISEPLVNSDFVMEKTFWLGIHPSLGETELSYVLEQLEKAVD